MLTWSGGGLISGVRRASKGRAANPFNCRVKTVSATRRALGARIRMRMEMNVKNHNVTAMIGFPATAPVEGHFASLACLDAHGYLTEGGDYPQSLARAGFSVVVTDGRPYLGVCKKRKGLFANGVGASAEEMFGALASEGFEGKVSDTSTGKSWYLSSGRLIREDMRMCA